MADQQLGNLPGVAAVAGKNLNGGDDLRVAFNQGVNDNDIASMRARLTAISATTYPVATLNTMTYNDMMYAIRLNDSASTIK